MIEFNFQQIRDGITPVFQPPDTDYAGRMQDIKSASVSDYDIHPFEVSNTEIPPDIKEIKEIIDMDYQDLETYDWVQIVLPNYGWKPGDAPITPDSIPISENTLYMCIKNIDLPDIALPYGDNHIRNNTNIVWAYKEDGKTFVSSSLLGYAPERNEIGKDRPQMPIQNEAY
jgi:hypothetical protein